MPHVELLPEGYRVIDTRMAGMTSVTAGYLIDSPRPALVECGPALSVGNVIASLRHLGMDPGDLAYLVVSHVHLDHAGGAGRLLQAFPSATVVVSEVGARHLVDPERLNRSSRRVYGDLMDSVYGECSPIPEPRVVGVADGHRLDLGGGKRLDLLYTPGHAKHHIAAFDPDTGALFVGDSVGVKMPGMDAIRPATPPPDFDLLLAQRTLDRYRELSPARVYLAHYGAVEPPLESLDEASTRLRAWFETAESAYREHSEIDHVAETLAQRFAAESGADPGAGVTSRVEVLSSFTSNAAGMVRYIEQREAGKVAT